MIDYKDIIASIDPSTIAQFLARKGYIEVSRADDYGQIYENQNNTVFILPPKKFQHDYIRRVHNIIEYFMDDDLGFHDSLCLISLPASDVIKYRLQSADTASGLLRLGYGHVAIRSLFDLIRFSAAGESTRLREYRNMSEQAKEYANSCRFGQTEIGSFILKVFCPTNPSAISALDYEPFGRRATRAVMQNLEFVSDERSEDPSEPLPQAMNQQVLEAIEKLKPYSDFSDAIMRVRYEGNVVDSSANFPDLTEPTTQQLNLGPFAFSRAHALRLRLKRAEDEGREVVEGYITDLHKDVPTKDYGEQRVSLTVRHSGIERKVVLRLANNEYKLAIQWHDNNIKVRLDALFDKRSKPWSVLRTYKIAPVQNDPSLFD